MGLPLPLLHACHLVKIHYKLRHGWEMKEAHCNQAQMVLQNRSFVRVEKIV